jgi:hypothetical protein
VVRRKILDLFSPSGHSAKHDAFAKTHKMAKQKFRPTRLGVFSGAKAYVVYVEVLKKCRNAVGRTFCDAIKHGFEIGKDRGSCRAGTVNLLFCRQG